MVFVPVCFSLDGNEDQFYTDWDESFQSFDQMTLNEGLLRGIYAYGKPLAPRQAGPKIRGRQGCGLVLNTQK